MRILIIEDEAPMAELLTKHLEPFASKIDTTDDLNTALHLVEEKSYNVVIQELKLIRTGKEQGLKAIREFKKHNVGVVVVSGVPDPKIKEEVLAAGADAFVPKDGGFNERAILTATNVATLKLPQEGIYKSESYQPHVELLRRMCEAT